MKLSIWTQKRASWLRKRQRPIAIAAIAIGLTLAVRPLLWPGGFGFRADQSVTTTVETVTQDTQGNPIKSVTTTRGDPGKTLWDWLSLLGVPLSLAVLGYWLQQQQQERAASEAKEEVLQVYFDRISTLLVDKNLLAVVAEVYPPEVGAEGYPQETALAGGRELIGSATNVIRARTLSILRRFGDDYERKTSVARFLLETEIVSKLKLDLGDADLNGADLSYADLRGADLDYANLHRANLLHSNLSDADLNHTKLSGAKLINTFLHDADLSDADLRGADLSDADLKGAFLHDADLSDADLRGANLNSTYLGGADLSRVSFDNNTNWPTSEEVARAKNIPDELKKQLGIE